MTRKEQDRSRSVGPLEAQAEILWQRPLGTQESPERPFPFIHGPPRASVDAKSDPAVFRAIRPIAVLTGPAHQNRPVLGHVFPQLGATKIAAGP